MAILQGFPKPKYVGTAIFTELSILQHSTCLVHHDTEPADYQYNFDRKLM